MKAFFKYPINEIYSLVKPDITMAAELFELINENEEHIGRFLPIPKHVKNIEDEAEFLRRVLKGEGMGSNRQFFIADGDKLIGSIDIHKIDQAAESGEVGYWLSGDQAGAGIMTNCLKVLCRLAFEAWGFNKLVLLADVENAASNKVALKAGFHFIGTDPEEIFDDEVFHDANRYCLTKSMYESQKG